MKDPRNWHIFMYLISIKFYLAIKNMTTDLGTKEGNGAISQAKIHKIKLAPKFLL